VSLSTVWGVALLSGVVLNVLLTCYLIWRLRLHERELTATRSELGQMTHKIGNQVMNFLRDWYREQPRGPRPGDWP
jgi:hypothetical protein